MILVIDNYDSFTFNLVQYLGELGANIKVYRNDQISIKEAINLKPEKLLISPGPCTPKEAGISCNIIKEFAPKIPILGVCLGHQSLAEVFGGKVIQSDSLMHGKTSLIYHNSTGIFKGLSNPFDATRYHSLIVERISLPSCFDITAWTNDDIIMGIKHNEFCVHGVQFHPESILTLEGKKLLLNFLNF